MQRHSLCQIFHCAAQRVTFPSTLLKISYLDVFKCNDGQNSKICPCQRHEGMYEEGRILSAMAEIMSDVYL